VPQLGDVHARGVDPVPLQPGAVVGEVLADRTDEDRVEAQAAHAEGDVRGDAAAADVELLDQEGQRDLVQLVHHERVGEPALERHQVVGRDRAGDGDAHRSLQLLIVVVGRAAQHRKDYRLVSVPLHRRACLRCRGDRP
jgi:hypothetical protein